MISLRLKDGSLISVETLGVINYRPVYWWHVTDHDGSVLDSGSDLYGPTNSTPDLLTGMRSLLGFLSAIPDGGGMDEGWSPDLCAWAHDHETELAVLHFTAEGMTDDE